MTAERTHYPTTPDYGYLIRSTPTTSRQNIMIRAIVMGAKVTPRDFADATLTLSCTTRIYADCARRIRHLNSTGRVRRPRSLSYLLRDLYK